MSEKLLIIGARGHGKVVADIAIKMDKWEKIAFLDDDKNLKSNLDIKVIGTSKEIDKYIDDWQIFIAIGSNDIREHLINKLEKLEATIPTLIHPDSVIGKEVDIEKGTVIMGGVVINASTHIGKGCIINTGATIDHDNRIGDFVHISPGVNSAGNVSIGNKTWIGIGSIISNNLNICSSCIVGAGAVVVKDIEKSGTYVGSPARLIR